MEDFFESIKFLFQMILGAGTLGMVVGGIISLNKHLKDDKSVKRGKDLVRKEEERILKGKTWEERRPDKKKEVIEEKGDEEEEPPKQEEGDEENLNNVIDMLKRKRSSSTGRGKE